MKLLSILPAMTLLLAFCMHAQAQGHKVKETNNKLKVQGKGGMNGIRAMNLSYKAAYSSQFEMGDQQYATQVLNAWKGYDNNTWNNASNMLADTVTAILSDGTVLKGKDNFLNALKAYRGSFSAVQSEVDAWLTVNSVDQKNKRFVFGERRPTQKVMVQPRALPFMNYGSLTKMAEWICSGNS